MRAGRRAGTIRKDMSITDCVKAIEAPFLYTRLIDGELISPQELERVLAALIESFAPTRRSGNRSSGGI